MACEYDLAALKKVGDYGDPIQRSIYLQQLGVWCFIVIVARLLILGLEMVLVSGSVAGLGFRIVD